jgi:hypothetical protein
VFAGDQSKREQYRPPFPNYLGLTGCNSTVEMYRQPSIPSSNIDALEDSLLDISTAPTTPDGSLTFSPVLQALKLHDALEEAALGWGEQRASSSSLDATMRASGSGVKNICCVGAGYVGELCQDQQLIPC